MSKILFHYTSVANRESIRQQGLSLAYDQTSREAPGRGVVYLIDRLVGSEEGRDLWQQARPGGSIPEGASDEELMAYFDQKRALEAAWAQSMRRALSRGEMTNEEAKQRDFWNPEGGTWEKLPTKLYHVTTNAGQVLEDGLKTRRELGTDHGLGLGGGSSDAISFTENLAVAEGIASSLREMHDVACGKTTVDDLLEAARVGKDAKRPFLAEMLHYWDRDWKIGDALPVGVKALLGGTVIERGKLGEAPDKEHEWRVEREGKQASVWIGGNGKTYSSYYERDASETEKQESRIELFKRFSAFREWASGPLDPLYFSSDAVALAKTDKEQIQILQVAPSPNAQGYRMNSLGEWRTGSGEGVLVQGVVKAGKLKVVAGDVWAVDVEGLELEEDIIWSGEGKSFMVGDTIAPERLQLLSAEVAREVDVIVEPGENCLGHTEKEIQDLVRGVGDRWEAVFKLWRAIDPDSDVPRCRTLLGQAEWGDGWPPDEVRALVGLDKDGRAVSQTTWVQPPYEMVGAGEDRFGVALCAEHLLKIDPYWRNATDNEVEVWGNASEKLRSLLSPVLANGEVGDYGWLVMPRCAKLVGTEDAAREKVREVLGLGDVHDYNLGFLNGRVVIFDYGTFDESGPVVHKSEAARLVDVDV